jgi:NTE family protein
MPLARPDVLVLAGGGTLGEAWMRGLLDGAGTAAGIDFRRCEYFVGTSAGSIVASFLAAGRAPDSGAEARAAKDWAEAADANGARRGRFAGLSRLGAALATPVAPIALASAGPGGAVVRAVALKAVPPTQRSMPGLGRLIDAEGARFDGRLRVVAVDRRNGRRVVFGAPDAPAATVGQAVLASCSVPWIFAPVRIGEREYVDGGVWSPTNLDVAPARRGSEVLCLNPTASLPAGRGRALRTFSRSAAAAETLVLRARGATVRTIGPDARAAEAMGLNLMDRGRVPQVLAAGYAQGRALAA